MRIKRLVLLDFGKFHQEEFMLSPGLNIATGANESGKTTLRRFIRSMFYGLERERGIKARKDDYTRYKPWEYGRYQGILEFESEGELYRLFRNFLTTEKEVRLTNPVTGKEIPQPSQFLREQGLVSEAVYVNTFWIGNDCSTEELLAEELKDYLANLAYSGGAGLNLQKSLAWLATRKKEVLRQVPEQELAACMEQWLKKDLVQERVNRIRYSMENNLRRQKELEGAIKVKKGMSEQVALERKLAEKEERQRFKGEWLLTMLCMTAILSCGISFFLPMWQLKVAGWCLGGILLISGLGSGLPKIKRGKEAGVQKETLEHQLKGMSIQLEELYQEFTGLLPEMEQNRLQLEQEEELLQSCDVAKERYEELKGQQEKMLKEAEALDLASDTLGRLSVELYEEFGAKFAVALSEYARAFTDHSYETLTADEELTLRAVTAERSLDISDVSFGTREQFYLALRFAAADVFDPEKRNPVILDDSFAAFDDQRLESAILALNKCGRQVLVLSSTGREEAAAKRMGITYEAIF